MPSSPPPATTTPNARYVNERVEWREIGDAYSQLGEHDKARQAVRKAISLKPDVAEFWKVLAGVTLEKATRQHPKVDCVAFS
jgi:tetratricopeptide (TPR) repeat protein